MSSVNTVNIVSGKIVEEGKEIVLRYPLEGDIRVKSLALSPVEFYKRQFEIILRNVDEISETHLYLLSYIKVFGMSYKTKILEHRICTTKPSINTYESVLRSKGILQGFWPDLQINPEIILSDKEGLLLIQYLIKDEDNDEIFHRNFQR
jgi:hypothetical protein